MKPRAERSFTPSDSVKRTLRFKQFANDVRIYAVYGDVTNAEALAEIGQELALSLKVERVVFKL